jgi:23S rRNA-/tRNA-specific pseudouridylate synthase
VVKEAFGRFVWVEAQPITYREMQVQAHLAAVGAPVVGDDAHGLPEVKLLLSGLKRGYKGRAQERPLIDRLALHASELTLRHPVSREDISFTAPIPKEFEIALRNLRKFARR